MEKKIEITYRWWHDESDTIEETHLPELESHAEERIREMRNDDYTSGELNTEIDGIYYNGWWEMTTKTVK